MSIALVVGPTLGLDVDMKLDFFADHIVGSLVCCKFGLLVDLGFVITLTVGSWSESFISGLVVGK